MQETTRCFVYVTNEEGETLAIAVEGPHTENDDIVFAPEWVFNRLGLSHGDEIIMDAIIDQLPKGETVRLRPITGVTVEGPMFLEGLTEALNQLGIVQEGLLSAIVDPSMPDIHEFIVDNLNPAKVCLADGELRVDLERALDRPDTPTPPSPARIESPVEFQEECECNSPVTPISPVAKRGYVPFGGTGYRLDGK
jgi:hypothetical protein